MRSCPTRENYVTSQMNVRVGGLELIVRSYLESSLETFLITLLEPWILKSKTPYLISFTGHSPSRWGWVRIGLIVPWEVSLSSAPRLPRTMTDRYYVWTGSRLQVCTLPGAFKSLVVLCLIRVTPEKSCCQTKKMLDCLNIHSYKAKAGLVFYLGCVRYTPHSWIRIYMIE